MLLARRLVAAWLVRLGYALGGRVRRLSGSNVRLAQPLLRRIAYSPPRWALSLRPPAGKIVLGHLPTPLMPWACPELAELGISWVIKRDDMTGMELSGPCCAHTTGRYARLRLTERCRIGGTQATKCASWNS